MTIRSFIHLVLANSLAFEDCMEQINVASLYERRKTNLNTLAFEQQQKNNHKLFITL